MPGINFEITEDLHRKAKVREGQTGASSLKDYFTKLIEKDTKDVELEPVDKEAPAAS